jgi:hypothetical protein
MTKIMETLNRVSAAAYQASASEAGTTAPDDGAEAPGPDGGPSAGAGDETVEGEFKEV